ncbi:MAG: HAD family hydrolase [Candidatus Bathyarchaeota archaeon]|jgi:putative hydrolase of the HAD superfamily|nr:HAD family hydrolase [Candidatus Bathyarchaeota archaeon A05DMB-5]MDH7558372.1 HAD family hydrolase [Candidatus Bathyarchaeota archaeon]
MKDTVLFDLGNTLAYYFERHEFPEILKQAITEVQTYLRKKNLLRVTSDVMWNKVKEENYEANDYRVRPLEERLIRIFQVADLARYNEVVRDMCCCFMKPIFARSYLYEDTLPTLKELRTEGYKIAIVSNTTWGSPAFLWREEIERLGLSKYTDAAVFCRDVGWRKPAKQIFEYTLEKLQSLPQNCVFVGDDPRWDQVGPRNVGITPIIIDRKRIAQQVEEVYYIRSLYELPSKLKSL